MNLLKKKMLLAPILAVSLAFLLAGAVSNLPLSPQPSPNPVTPLPGNYWTSPTQIPQPLPTSPPVAQTTTSVSSNLVSILFGIAAVAVGIIAACLLFSERSLKKEISETN